MNEILKIENFLEKDEEIEDKSKDFEKIMFIYSIALKDIEMKIENIKEEFKLFYNYDLIDHVNTRIKTVESICSKMKDKEIKKTYSEMIKNINDIAGIRIICPLKKDVYTIRNIIINFPGIKVLKEKDYIINPKKSGYSSYHIIIEVPITLSQSSIYTKVEVQIRTMAMDFWSSIEHKIKYKSKNEIDSSESKKLIEYAKIMNKLDNKIMALKS